MMNFFEKLSDVNSRVMLMIIGIIIANLILCVKVFETAIGGGAITTPISEDSRNVARANIIDKNGQVIATNLPTASLYANPNLIENKELAVKELLKLFPELNKERLKERLNAKSHFSWVMRHISPKMQQRVNELGIIGLNLIKDTKRIYPGQHSLAHIIGNVDWDNNGVSGLEKQFDDFLRYSAGENKKLQLTFDSNVQEVIRDILIKHVKKQDALGGAAIVMDPHTGDVIAMVSVPDYDSNNVNKAKSEQLFNRVTKGLYEPGSTMKALSVAMALDAKAVSIDGVFNVSQPIRYGKFQIKDFRMREGELSVPDILKYSSNIGTVRIAHAMGKEKQQKYMQDFGMLNRLDLEITEKSTPLFPKNNRWGEIASSTISFGHGIAVSPLHVITAYAPLVNGGLFVTPRFVKNIKKEEPHRILSEKTSDNMRKLLRSVVKAGAGRRAETDGKGYFIGGKTGSAEKTSEGKYLRDANISSFCGAFPINKPKYLVYVMVDEAKKNEENGGYTTGGRIAAPLAGEVVKNIAPMLNVAPSSDIKAVEEELSLERLEEF